MVTLLEKIKYTLLKQDGSTEIWNKDGYVAYKGNNYKIIGVDLINGKITLPLGGPIGKTIDVGEVGKADD